MIKFIIRRLFSMVTTMLIVSIVVFLISEASPGNVARNILGPFATPQQEASFQAQLGLNQPLYLRYVTWLIGSDRRASRIIGYPVTQIQREQGFVEWWAIDGNLVRWRMDENDLIQLRLLPDGNIQEVLDNEKWRKTEQEGVEEFWGVDTQNRITHWIRGTDVTVWLRATGAGWWVPQSGGGVDYIPLSKGLLRGDPGYSIQTGRPIMNTLPRRFLNSVLLAAIAFIVVMPIAVFLGIIAAINHGKLIDRFLTLSGLVFTASPQYGVGILLILVFSSWLQILPGATVFDQPNAVFQKPSMLVLPVLTLVLIELGYILRITRASMLEVMQTGYFRTAILKGLPMSHVIKKHALRNALLAPITVIMYHVNWLVGGLVVIEAIFGYPGVGKYVYDAAMYKDVFVMQTVAVLLVGLAVITQLIADVIYTFLNPRIRYE